MHFVRWVVVVIDQLGSCRLLPFLFVICEELLENMAYAASVSIWLLRLLREGFNELGRDQAA